LGRVGNELEDALRTSPNLTSCGHNAVTVFLARHASIQAPTGALRLTGDVRHHREPLVSRRTGSAPVTAATPPTCRDEELAGIRGRACLKEGVACGHTTGKADLQPAIRGDARMAMAPARFR
jgi:hypothetical protein